MIGAELDQLRFTIGEALRHLTGIIAGDRQFGHECRILVAGLFQLGNRGFPDSFIGLNLAA